MSRRMRAVVRLARGLWIGLIVGDLGLVIGLVFALLVVLLHVLPESRTLVVVEEDAGVEVVAVEDDEVKVGTEDAEEVKEGLEGRLKRSLLMTRGMDERDTSVSLSLSEDV